MKGGYMKKLLMLILVLLTFTVFLRDGRQYCAKEVYTGAYGAVRIITCDNQEVLIPYHQILRIEQDDHDWRFKK